MFDPQRILFVGMKPLASQCLSHLIQRMGREAIIGVHTKQHEGQANSNGESYHEVREVAERHGLPLCSESDLLNIECDLLLCIMWDKRINDDILVRPRYGCINFHPAPLPDYGGILTRSHAILNGDNTFGPTMHYMVHDIDKGDIIGDIKFPILPEDTAYTLSNRTMAYGYVLFCETWQRLLDGSATRRPQADISKRTGRPARYYNGSSLESFMIEPSSIMTSQDIDRRFRALTNPPDLTPPAWLEELHLQKQ